jgi:methylated-DNA-[protein]-cysteine S-methyltransferase
MRRNPLPIIIPCHRVIASGGSLHGFAGSVDGDGRELAAKRALLEMEGALVDEAVLPGLSQRGKRTPARATA